MKPRVVILRVAGTNCDRETEWAFSLAGALPERVHINEIIAGRRKLSEYQILVLPGGFSYGDDIGAGKVLANELRFLIRDEIGEFIGRKKPVLGVCNGFQVLVKAGLLPGPSARQTVTLGWNDSGRFEDRWVHLKVEDSVCRFVRGLPDIIRLPVAHGEGKFIPSNDRVLAALEKRKQVVFRYAAPSGEHKGYPFNPNGSTAHVAGICDPSGLILGLMPHPERCLLKQHYPDWFRLDDGETYGVGFSIFRNMVEYVL
jgi:phosphoribosylformylglycinamidine synthase subunit PurQ / glutaminase